jgi:two-component system response regulator AtoC
LRDRAEDLEELVPFFLRRINQDLHTRVTDIEAEAMRLLREHPWPGNVRELINVLTRAALDSRGEVLLAEAVSRSLTSSLADLGTPRPHRCTSDEERDLLFQVLGRHGWNISAAARTLSISRPTLRKRLKKHGLRRPDWIGNRNREASISTSGKTVSTSTLP